MDKTKDFPAHVEDALLDREQLAIDYAQATKSVDPIVLSDLFENSNADSVWSSDFNVILDMQRLKSLFFDDDWVYILVDRIASKIAAQELKVVREQISDGKSIYEPVADHPVQAKIWNPNDKQTYYDWMYSIVCDLALCGNGIVWYARLLNKLITIPIEMVQPDVDRDGTLKKYRIVQSGMYNGIPDVRHVMDLLPADIAHCRRPNPSSAIWGLSPFLPGRRSVLFNRYSQEYLINFYQKGAQPGMVFDMGDVANEKATLRLLRSMEQAHNGRRNQRRNMVLPKGVKANTFAHTLADQQLREYIDQNRETIINILQVPKHELSIATAGSLGSEEYRTALKNFWQGPLRSMMRSIEASLGKMFADELGEKHFLQFDLSDVEILQDDFSSKADTANKLLQTHTLNEVRSSVFNLEPLPGGDETPGQVQANPFGAFAQSRSATAPEAKAEVAAEIQTPEQDSGDERSKILQENMFIFNELKASVPNWWSKRDAMITEGFDQDLIDVHRIVLDLFSDQVTDAIRLVRAELKRQDIKSLRTKADEQPKFSKAKLLRDLRSVLESKNYEERWIDEMVKILEKRIDLGYGAQLILPFNLPSRSELEAARARNEDRRRDMAEQRLSESFKQMNKTTTDKIFTIVEDAIKNSQTIDQAGQSIAQVITENMRKTFTSEEFINTRAALIAHQELMTAASLGQAAAVEDASEVIPGLKKMWIAAGDDRVRGKPTGLYPDAKADHWHLSGEVVDADEDFIDTRGNRLAFPRDPKAPPEAIMRCRCTMVMVPGDEADSRGIRQLKPEFQNTGE